MTVYKVVHSSNGRYFSSNACEINRYHLTALDHPFIVEYKTGEWVEPKVVESPLLAFSSKEAAERFMLLSSFAVLECAYKQFLGEVRSRVMVSEVLSKTYCLTFWRSEIHRTDNGLPWPDETVFCSAIKPLRIL